MTDRDDAIAAVARAVAHERAERDTTDADTLVIGLYRQALAEWQEQARFWRLVAENALAHNAELIAERDAR